ncbi:hypothetical protein [Microlunatus sp. GCM10028923]|uniref:hypothetical protein n=1 Tax=Microlunatus sp. GCM10028923 TaxID=3273400 RepID=UPI00361CF307
MHSAASSAHAYSPNSSPMIVATACRRPRSADRRTISAKAGPGVAVITTTDSRNAGSTGQSSLIPPMAHPGSRP